MVREKYSLKKILLLLKIQKNYISVMTKHQNLFIILNKIRIKKK